MAESRSKLLCYCYWHRRETVVHIDCTRSAAVLELDANESLTMDSFRRNRDFLTAISGVTNSDGGPPAGSVGMGTQASPGQVLGAPPGAITNSVVSLNAPTRLEWLDQEPITLKYVPPPEGSVDAPTLRGTAGVRNSDKMGMNT